MSLRVIAGCVRGRGHPIDDGVYGGSRGQRCHEGAHAHGSQGERERNDGKMGRRERQTRHVHPLPLTPVT